MLSLRETILHFKKEGRALGHFNFSDSNQLTAIAQASRETSLPVIAGLSEAERGYFPLHHARALVNAYQKDGIEIYLNADHTYHIDLAKAAIDTGVDSLVVDGAALSLAENIKLTLQAVAYAHSKKRFLGGSHHVLVEGELGYIGTSSKPLDSLPAGVSVENLTTPEDAKKFVEETGVDCFAPAVGNVHGMLKNAAEPRLNPTRVKEVAQATGVPLVLHGASGNTPEDILACIQAGVAVVHINTELRALYRDSLRRSLAGEETTPYKFLEPAVEEMKEFLVGKMRMFANR